MPVAITGMDANGLTGVDASTGLEAGIGAVKLAGCGDGSEGFVV